MERVNVVIADIKLIDQLLHLPTRYEYDDKLWCITFAGKDIPLFVVEDNQEKYSHDMLIQPRWNTLYSHAFDYARRIWFLDRFDKIKQNVNIDYRLGQFGLHHYTRLPVSEINFDTPKPLYHFDDSEYNYVIKPTGGARSMGIIFVEKQINLREFLTKLQKLRANKKSKNKNYIKLFKQFGLRYLKGEENRPDEMAKVLAENTLMIQKMNPYDDVIEFRALSGSQDPLFFKRNHLTDNGVNITDTIIDSTNAEDYFAPTVYAEIKSVLSTGKLMTYGSHDIWYSPSNECWGIYEYQNQYGHVHIPAKPHLDFLKESLKVAYDRLTGQYVFND